MGQKEKIHECPPKFSAGTVGRREWSTAHKGDGGAPSLVWSGEDVLLAGHVNLQITESARQLAI